MALATLNGVPLPFDPDSVAWDYQIKTHVEDTIGGRVVQVIGTRLGDMSVAGSFRDWEAQDAFYRRVAAWVDRQTATKGRATLRFVYTPKRWDMHVLIKAFRDGRGNGITHDNNIIAPRYLMTLFVVQDNVGNITRGIQDAYIARLVEGVGWKFSTDYNGPDAMGNESTVLGQFQAAAAGTASLPGGQ